ncbi:hypothetical protein PS645_00715 [Pseudomonas fluorescens]|uniref:Uncharacterized protein n=1 Tax=Pseudomonas fluorescens TaxID=294 RepID=A0A5E6Q1S7_PSEFL|nr:hypothetical protein PS645_00715 [Pseudomonas fluorescens]
MRCCVIPTDTDLYSPRCNPVAAAEPARLRLRTQSSQVIIGSQSRTQPRRLGSCYRKYRRLSGEQLALQFVQQRLDRIQPLLRIVELQQINLVHFSKRQQVRQLISQ